MFEAPIPITDLGFAYFGRLEGATRRPKVSYLVEEGSVSPRIKSIVARVLIVIVAFLVAFYEPGLAVFAVGGGVAAFMIVRNGTRTPDKK